MGAGTIFGVASLCGCLVLLLEKVGRCIAGSLPVAVVMDVEAADVAGAAIEEGVVEVVVELFLGADGKALVAVSREFSGVVDWWGREPLLMLALFQRAAVSGVAPLDGML